LSAQAAARELIVRDLSSLATRLLETGGAAALAAGATALAEGAAAALPGALLPEFSKVLLEAVASGARMAGHSVTITRMEPDEAPIGGLH
jgi:hypothetical protein